MSVTEESIENAFRNMTEEQKRMSFSMNSRHVLPSANKPKLRQELLCALCSAILVEPLTCVECGTNYHTGCLNKFCRETGSCPMMCKKPKFVPVKREILRELSELKF